jgi:hypothetical protein
MAWFRQLRWDALSQNAIIFGMFKRDTEAARQARGKDSDLEQRVRRDLTFLFDQYGAVVSSNTLQAHGNSEVSVAVGNLEFQFAKNERDGENRAVVGPRNGHGVWELLSVALAASTGEDATTLTCPLSYSDNPAGLSYIGLTKLASLLKPRFDRLNEAFAPENYLATRSRTAEIERNVHPR